MNTNRRTRLFLESLEARIAPASVLSFTDVDGDKVRITASAGELTGKATFVSGGVGQQLQVLDLISPAFQGASITTFVTRAPTGDGLVNIGRINATGRDLGSIIVNGDLADIDCGDADFTTTGLRLLSVRSMGLHGMATQDFLGDLQSNILGALGKLSLDSDLAGASVSVSGGGNGKIGSVRIGGSIIGGSIANSGQVQSTGDMGPVFIGGDIVGGTDSLTGAVDAGGKLANLTVGGSLIGGAGFSAGSIIGNNMVGPITIRHDVKGGLNFLTGSVSAARLTSVTIGGSLLGGFGVKSGSIFSVGDMGPTRIAHDLVGGSGDESGKIDAGGKLAGVTIGGSLVGGSAFNTGMISGNGDLGAVTIGHDVLGGSAFESGLILTNGKLAGVTVYGSLIGGVGIDSGEILSDGDMGAVKIGHDVLGGPAAASGRISTHGKLAGMTVGGSLIGSFGLDSGEILSSGDMGAVRIGHDVQGASGVSSGVILSNGKLADVTIGGSLIGGPETSTGEVFSAGDMGVVKIGRDLIGGSIPAGAPVIVLTGYIEGDHIARIEVGGSIIAGIDASDSGALVQSASIRARHDIGSLTVHGSLIGDSGPHGDSFVIISARGQMVQGATSDVAIGRIAVGGRVEFAQVFAGYDADLNAVSADAQIGSVTVGGDWAASSLLAGTVNLGADDAPGGIDANADNIDFGDSHDHKISGSTDSPAIISQIGSIVIAGQVFGTPSAFSNLVGAFGFVAERIGALSVGGNPITLQGGPNNDGRVLPPSTNMRLHEIDAAFASTHALVASARLVNPSTVAYMDVDGDHVTVTLSKPLLNAGNVNDVFKFDNSSVGGPNTFGQQLQLIDLTLLATNGLNLTVNVSPGGGDRLANVGYINSTGFRLGTVLVAGDLGQIDAGSTSANLPGVQSLSLRSMGRLGMDTQSLGFGRSLDSRINNGLGSLRVTDDIVAARLAVNGRLGSVTIGGSLIGGKDSQSGFLSALEVGPVRIGRDLQGGVGISSGQIDTAVKTGPVTIGGSLIGGPGPDSGRLVTDGSIGPVTIGGNLLGGSAERTGLVEGPKLASVALGGSLIGGSALMSGQLFSYTGDIGAVQIAHNLAGGSGDESGKIDCGGTLAALTIGGSLIGGSGQYDTTTDANGFDHFGQVYSVGDMGLVKIGHDLQGGSGLFSGTVRSEDILAGFMIGGSLLGGSDLESGAILGNSIGTVQIGHDLRGGSGNASGVIVCRSILAGAGIGGSLIGGSDQFSGAIFSTVDIGPVRIGHDFLGVVGGEILGNGKLASVQIGGSFAGGSAGRAGRVLGSRIGSVTIGHNLLGGSITGSTASLDQTGYIESSQGIASVSIGGSVITGIDNSSSGSLTKNASIRAGADIGTISVKGSLIGNVTPNGRSPVIISAAGPFGLSTTANVAIANIMIGGGVKRANIFAGYSTSLIVANDGVEITAVNVGRDWVASNVVASMQNFGADDVSGGVGANEDNVNFGDPHDTFIGLGDVTDRIGRIAIGGVVAGSSALGDHFGFVSHVIGSFRVGTFAAPLAASNDVVELSPITGDVTVHEV